MNAKEEFAKLDLDNSRNRLTMRLFLKSHAKEAPELGKKVEARLAEIDALEERDLAKAKKVGRIHDYHLFLQKWNALSISPKASKFVNERIAELKEQEEQAWAEAAEIDKAKAYRAFLKKWPDGAHADLAKKEIGKRFELFNTFLFKKNADGNRELRLIFGLPGVFILIVLLAPFIGIAGLVLLGLSSVVATYLGFPDFSHALVGMGFSIFVFVKYILGKATEGAGGIAVITVIATIAFVGLGGWLGIPFYDDYMHTTGL